MKYYIAIPTYNGGRLWQKVVDNIKEFTPSQALIQVIDSGSKDGTEDVAEKAGFDVITIEAKDFNHGGTRNFAIEKHADSYDVVIFLTQDAIPQPNFINEIISVFESSNVACAYGRQLPHTDANPLAQHARFFNYPEKGYICGKEDIPKMGLKTVFMSNSFSAYRLSTFKELGGFPSDTILCEDMYFTTKAILAGYKVAYVSTAKVRHSHNYTPLEEFKRYFDIGVFHKDEPWIRKNISGASGEGKKFLISEIRYLLNKYPHWIPLAFVNNFMKLLGYKLGQHYNILPTKIIKAFSMHKRYWS
ncbi:glycosyltransferase family 2 protein [Klebsiella michiganensis]|uniref:glycosyltransferase family 2 protein n=1 Tax=Klebsiella michiganensis TaxID=1134687 RepID=UPI001CCB42F0|nr:glycosyltransferase [Klebsiella michiganensis]MBZ7394700.1 glycosyltransferase family 2 protein [Klebsiella michiganensis]